MDMRQLLRIRGGVLFLIEKARGSKYVFRWMAVKLFRLIVSFVTGSSRALWRLKLILFSQATLVKRLPFWNCSSERVCRVSQI